MDRFYTWPDFVQGGLVHWLFRHCAPNYVPQDMTCVFKTTFKDFAFRAGFTVQVWQVAEISNKSLETKARLQKLILGKVHACKCGLVCL